MANPKILEIATALAANANALVAALADDGASDDGTVASDVAAACRDYFKGAQVHMTWLTQERRAKGRAAFLAAYPPGNPRPNAAQPGGETAPPPRADVVDIGLYPGANDIERAVNAYRATVKGAENMEYDAVFIAACEARRTGRFVNLSGRS